MSENVPTARRFNGWATPDLKDARKLIADLK